MARAAVKTRTRRLAAPKLLVEQGCFEAGDQLVCGIDEVGRGAWAGPVTVGAVVIGPAPKRIQKVRDSKELTARAAGGAVPQDPRVGPGLGRRPRQPGGVRRAGDDGRPAPGGGAGAGRLADDGCVPDRIILDGNHDYFGRPDQVRTVIDGDALCLSVAAASIVAKVTRDRIMAAEAECYPGYDFDSNRGYRSYRHRCALLGYGPTAIHRRSWVCMENLPWASRSHRRYRSRP